MKFILVTLFSVCVVGCHTETEEVETIISGMAIDTQLEFAIRNSAGEDLLSSDVSNHFPREQIKVYDYSNGTKTISDHAFIKERGFYTLIINTKSAVYRVDTKGESITLLQFSNTVVDTVRAEWKAGRHYFYNAKIWYNNELKWIKDQELPIVIIK